MFVVILFEDENAVSIVPHSWMGKGKVVHWPKCSVNRREKLARAGKPFEGEHDKLHVAICGMAASYGQAKLIEKETINESTMKSFNGALPMTHRPKRVCKKPRKIMQTSDDSTSDDNVQESDASPPGSVCPIGSPVRKFRPVLPLAPHPSTQTATLIPAPLVPVSMPDVHLPTKLLCQPGPSTVGNQPLLDKSFNLYSHVQQPSTSDRIAAAVSMPLTTAGTVEGPTLYTLSNQLHILTKMVTDIGKRLISLEENAGRGIPLPQTSDISWDELHLPLTSATAFADFQMHLCDVTFKNKYISALSNVTGTNIGQFVRNALQRTIATTLAIQMSLTGQNGKIALKDSVLMEVVMEYLQCNIRYPSTTREQIHQVIRDWIHNSRHRNANEMRRRVNANSTEIIEEFSSGVQEEH